MLQGAQKSPIRRTSPWINELLEGVPVGHEETGVGLYYVWQCIWANGNVKGCVCRAWYKVVKGENIMSGKKWPWIAMDVSEVLDEDGVFIVLRQCEDGFPEIVACYEDAADAQAEADERNAEEEQ